jgi:ATP-binding cassette subfamily B protein
LKSLSALNKYFLRYKHRLVFGLLFVVLSNLFAVFPAQSVRKVFDLVKEKLHDYQLAVDESVRQRLIQDISEQVLYFSLLILAFALIKGIFMYLMRQTLIVMSRHIEFDMKNDIYRHLQQMPQSFFRSYATGDIMARISEDVSRVRMYIGPAIMYMMNLSVTIIIVVWAMFSVNAELAIWVLTPLPVLSYIIFKVNNIINQRSDAIQSQLSSVSSYVQESFAGIRVLKAYALEKTFLSAFAAQNDEYYKRNMSLAKVDALFFPSMVLLTGLSSLFTIWVGGRMVISNEISIGNIAEFVIYVNLLIWPVTSLGWTSSLIQRAAASQARINEFLEQEADEHYKRIGKPLVFNKSISVKNLSHTYESKRLPALQQVNFEVKKGSKVLITGPTGSGKTTLMQLMAGAMEVQQGEISVDHVSLFEIDKASYRHAVAYAPQDVFLFSDTIEQNILFGADQNELPANAAELAARMADLHDNIMQFPLGYQTIIGERGVTLSGGQKQRLALARAFIKNAPILLLDETLSAVDTGTEKRIVKEIVNLSHDVTLFIVSHRLSLVHDVNHIIVIENGIITEQGTHDELMNENGYYAKQYIAQTTI